MGVIKMSKNIKIATVVMSLGLVLFAYQNCSQIQPGLLVTDNKASSLSVDDGTQAIIFDEQDNIIEVVPETPVVEEQAPVEQEMPAEQQDAEPVVTAPVEQEETAAPAPEVVVEEPMKENQPDKQPIKEEIVKEEVIAQNEEEVEQEETAEVIQASSCVELAQKHKNSIDVSKLDAGAKISLLKGKTFIYSSAGPKAISSLSIGKACGRTILCDVTIEKIGEVNGRLDLYKDSSVKEYDSQPKNIKRRQ